MLVLPREVTRSPDAFRELLSREQVTVLSQTPSAFRQLQRIDESAGAADPLSLRYVVFGGEALDAGSVRRWFARHDDRTPRLVNMYGITETTVHVTHRKLRDDDFDGVAQRPIGGPLPGWELYLLDECLRPVPPGVTGEIFVGGAGLARGYLNQSALTAERFIPHPFSDRSGARLYRSGDLARRLRNGEIEYVGRNDEQVKVRGFRIELNEISETLMLHPDVREAVAVSREDVAAGNSLVAYMVRRESATCSSGELRAFLKERLPEYMLPVAFVALESLPLTTNGKLDRRSLPAPQGLLPDAGADYVAPRTSTQQAIAAVWREVLGVERVGLHDNFFDLGGHSLSILEVHNRLKQNHPKLAVVELFKFPTVAALAEHLSHEEGGSPALVNRGVARATARRNAARQLAGISRKDQSEARKRL